MRHPILHATATAADLGVLRIVVFATWAVSVAATPMTMYAELPRELFTPVGFLSLMPETAWDVLMTPAALLTVKASLVAGCTLLTFGVRPFRPIAAVVVIMLLIYDGVMKSFNAWINHAQMGILFAAVVLALFSASDALSIFGRRRQRMNEPYGVALVACALLLCFAYTFIGMHRVVTGGLGVLTGDAIIDFVTLRSLENVVSFGFSLGLLVHEHEFLKPILRLGFAATTLFEILSPLSLFYRPFRWMWLAVIMPFHFITLVTMNIFFWENVLLILVLIAGAGALARGRQQTPAARRVILFDGVCNLCNATVVFVIDRDCRGQFRFAPLQSDVGAQMLAAHGVTNSKLASIVLLENGRAFERSTAALRIARSLDGCWPVLYAFIVVPRFVRDAVYNWIARHRYAWFGRTDQCRLPTPDLKSRFLDMS